jgi:hypothetical protein
MTDTQRSAVLLLDRRLLERLRENVCRVVRRVHVGHRDNPLGYHVPAKVDPEVNVAAAGRCLRRLAELDSGLVVT